MSILMKPLRPEGRSQGEHAGQSMVMVFSNPAYASADGGKLTKIKMQKDII